MTVIRHMRLAISKNNQLPSAMPTGHEDEGITDGRHQNGSQASETNPLPMDPAAALVGPLRRRLLEL